MSRRRALVVAAAAAVCAAGAAASLPVAVSVVLAVPLVLVLPGYALLEAIGGEALGREQRVVLVPALSIALDVVVALLVNFLPSGLTARSWAIALAAVVLAACVGAALRGAGTERAGAPGVRVRWADVVALAVALAVIAGAAVLARTPLAAKRAQGYTILALARGPGSTVVVDVRSGELAPTRYRLVVTAGKTVYRKETFELEPGSRRSVRVAVGSRTRPVAADLYRGKQARTYRRVHLR